MFNISRGDLRFIVSEAKDEVSEEIEIIEQFTWSRSACVAVRMHVTSIPFFWMAVEYCYCEWEEEYPRIPREWMPADLARNSGMLFGLDGEVTVYLPNFRIAP